MTGGPPQKKQKQSFQNRRPDQVEALHFDTDEALISCFEREAKKEFSEPYAKRLVSVLRKFSIWLCGTGRPPMAGRLNQLNVDMQAHAKVAGLDWELIHLLNTALAHLAEVAAGTPMNRRHATLGEHIKARCIDDEALISYFRAAELGLAPLTVVVNARRLRRFSDWLGARNKEPLARRLHDDSLTQDAHRYQDQTILHALRWLRLALPTVEAVLECVGPALQVRQQGGVSTSTGSQHGSSHRRMEPIPALERSQHIPSDWDSSLGANQNRSAPEEVRAQSEPTADILGPSAKGGAPQQGSPQERVELTSTVGWSSYIPPDLDGSRGANRSLFTPGERPNDAQSASTADVAGPDAVELPGKDIQNLIWPGPEDAMPSPVASMLPWDQALGLPSSAGAADPSSGFDGQRPVEDFGYALGFGWQHGRQTAPDPLIGELTRKNRLPTLFHPTDLNLEGRPYTAQLTGETRERTPNNPRGVNIMLIPERTALGLVAHGSAEVPMDFPRSVGGASWSDDPSFREGAAQHGTLQRLPIFNIEPASPWSDGGIMAASPQIQWDQIPEPSSSVGDLGPSRPSRSYDFSRADEEAGPSSAAAAGRASTTSGVLYVEPHDFGQFVDPDWAHGDWADGGQRIPANLMAPLHRWGQLPTPWGPLSTEFYIRGERYTAELRPRERDPNRILGSQNSYDVYLIHHPRTG